MKRIYITPLMKVVSSSVSSVMLAASNAFVDLGNPENSPKDDDRTDQPITPIEGGEALSKNRFYDGF